MKKRRQLLHRAELADGGTIFLDEVGELPLDQQAKLLRVLQNQQIERVSESRSRKIDVRVIAATNCNLKEEAACRRFREDLFFRLNVFPINSPPLRDRPDDIPLLTLQFVRRACGRAFRTELPISLADVERLKAYHWPGNIREPENVVERAVITAGDGRLRFNLPSPLASSPVSTGKAGAQTAEVITEERRKALERENLITVLRSCGGRVSGRRGGAAEIIGVPPTTFYSRLNGAGSTCTRGRMRAAPAA
jgi:formate hydrogenlyase transcriptional activator